MTSLLDIGPLTEEVPLGNSSVTVSGITPEGFFLLLDKFPTLREMFSKGSGSTDMDSLKREAPGSIAYALALATTNRVKYVSSDDWRADVEKAADVAASLAAHYQMRLFQSALRLTFPEGIGPFMREVDRTAASLNRVSGVETAPATTSSKPLPRGFVTTSRGMRVGRAVPSASSVH